MASAAATPAAFRLLPILDLETDLYGRYALADPDGRALYVSLAVAIAHAGERGVPLDLEAWATRFHLAPLERISAAWQLCAPLFELRDGYVHSARIDEQLRRERAFQATQARRGRRRWLKADR